MPDRRAGAKGSALLGSIIVYRPPAPRGSMEAIATLVRMEMTAKRDLKRRVRDRQAHTGESYMTALRHVRNRRPGERESEGEGAVPVIEMIDVSEIAAALGIQCSVILSPTLADRIDVATVLRQLRDALAATERDPAFALMRAVLRGENPVAPRGTGEVHRRFMARARAGIGGISEHGRMLALAVSGRRGIEMVLFMLRVTTVRHVRIQPALFVGSLDGIFVAGDLAIAWR
jgi:hypothetical protein